MTILAILLAIDLFTLPAIPEVLQTPADRLAFLAEHYWDHTPLSEDVIEQHQDQYEQYLVDFLSILPMLDAEKQGRLLRPLLAFSASLVRKYLCTKDSPIYAPETFQFALKSFQDNTTAWILFFEYRDDCNVCRETQESIEKSQIIARSIAEGRLRIKTEQTGTTPRLSLKTSLGETLISDIKVEEIETILM